MEETLSKFMTIEEKIIDIGRQIRLENKVCSMELQDRLEKGLEGDAAIKHYNEWMKRYHMEHLMVKED